MYLYLYLYLHLYFLFYFSSSKTSGYCSKCFKDLGLTLAEETPSTPEPEIPQEQPLPSTSSPQPEQVDTTRCWQCKRKVGLLGYPCKCNYTFCASHRYSDQHSCTYDYRGNQQEDLGKKLAKVVERKVEQF
jgi:hypothetical protein